MAVVNVRETDMQTSEAPGPQSAEPRRRRGKTLPSEEHERRLALYQTGKTDMQIAEVCGLTPKGVEEWRRRNGLPGNGMRGRRARPGRPALQPESMLERLEPGAETPQTSSREAKATPKPEPRPATATRHTPRHRVDPTDFDPMLTVDTKTGVILVDRRPDYLRRGAAEREARRAAEREGRQAAEQTAADSVEAGARLQGRSGG